MKLAAVRGFSKVGARKNGDIRRGDKSALVDLMKRSPPATRGHSHFGKAGSKKMEQYGQKLPRVSGDCQMTSNRTRLGDIIQLVTSSPTRRSPELLSMIGPGLLRILENLIRTIGQEEAKSEQCWWSLWPHSACPAAVRVLLSQLTGAKRCSTASTKAVSRPTFRSIRNRDFPLTPTKKSPTVQNRFCPTAAARI